MREIPFQDFGNLWSHGGNECDQTEKQAVDPLRAVHSKRSCGHTQTGRHRQRHQDTQIRRKHTNKQTYLQTQNEHMKLSAWRHSSGRWGGNRAWKCDAKAKAFTHLAQVLEGLKRSDLEPLIPGSVGFLPAAGRADATQKMHRWAQRAAEASARGQCGRTLRVRGRQSG